MHQLLYRDCTLYTHTNLHCSYSATWQSQIVCHISQTTRANTVKAVAYQRTIFALPYFVGKKTRETCNCAQTIFISPFASLVNGTKN